MRESKECNGVDRVPARAKTVEVTWPPPWLKRFELPSEQFQGGPIPESPKPSPGAGEDSQAISDPPPDPWGRWGDVAWPARCLESERLFGQLYARLFPLISDGSPQAPVGCVRTVRGPGRLLQVFADRVTVALDNGPKGKVTFLRPWEVWPEG